MKRVNLILLFFLYQPLFADIIEIKPNDETSGFGNSVDIYEDYAIFGAPGDDDNGNNTGAAYIFKYKNGKWIQQVKLFANDGNLSLLFGRNVSISNQYAIVNGRVYENSNKTNTVDIVYIYKKEGNNWNYYDRIYHAMMASCSEDFIIVGNISGSAILYKIDNRGITSLDKLDYRGSVTSVDIYSGNVIVGSSYHNTSHVQIFKISNDKLEQHAVISGNKPNDYGKDTSISKKLAIASATESTIVFSTNGSSWGTVYQIQNTGSVAVSDNMAICNGIIVKKINNQWIECSRFSLFNKYHNYALSNDHLIVGNFEISNMNMYCISGAIQDFENKGLKDIQFNIHSHGDISYQIPPSDSDGTYKAYLFPGWTGSIEPIAENVSPSSKSFTYVTTDIQDQDFILPQYLISGGVKDNLNQPISNAIIQATNDTLIHTNKNGLYQFYVKPTWTGTVSISKPGYYNFNPSQITFTNVLNNCIQNFTVNRFSLSGFVQNESNEPISGVKILFSNDGGESFTNSKGYFSHRISNNWSGSIIPEKQGYQFSPAMKLLENVNTDNDSINFTGFIYEKNAPLANIALKIGDNKTTLTDSSGFYMIDVDFGWSGTITPIKIGTSFEPSSLFYTQITDNYYNQNFEATQSRYIISGMIKDIDNKPLPKVLIRYAENETVETDDNGNYQLHIDYKWSGVIIPEKMGYHFIPDNRQYYDVIVSSQNQDFTASQENYNIFGNIINTKQQPMSNVTISIGDQYIMTDRDGVFHAVINYGWSGLIKPQRTGFNFEPAYYEISELHEDQINTNFTASIISYSISGKILNKSKEPLRNISILFNNGGGLAITDDKGLYTHHVKYGWSGNAIPKGENIHFRPSYYLYDIITNDISEQNFSAETNQIDENMPDWNIDETQYAYQMTITCILNNKKNEQINQANALLAAFVGNDVSGIAQPVETSRGNRFFLQVWSNNATNDMLQFKFWVPLINEIVEVEESLTFQASSAYGSIQEPFILHEKQKNIFHLDVNNDGKTKLDDIIILLKSFTGFH